jgi:hypothetical protein
MAIRALDHLAGCAEFAYEMWQGFAITTGVLIALLLATAVECRHIVELTDDDDNNNAAAHRVYDVVCKLQNNWQAHVDQELAMGMM